LKNNTYTHEKARHSRHKLQITLSVAALVACSFLLAPSFTSCNIYKFNEATIPDSIKTVKINIVENRAQYQNQQISQRLTDKIRQKVIGQTKLSPNNDNPDWEISATITQYSFSTSAISNQQVATNRLTVGVHVTLNDRKADEVKEFDVSRSFEFSGSQSLQQAENTLMDEMTRTLTDEIFNKLFSNW
jgi:hypothetical protein